MGEDHTEEHHVKLSQREYDTLEGLIRGGTAYLSASEWDVAPSLTTLGYAKKEQVTAFGARKVWVWEATEKGRSAWIRSIEPSTPSS